MIAAASLPARHSFQRNPLRQRQLPGGTAKPRSRITPGTNFHAPASSQSTNIFPPHSPSRPYSHRPSTTPCSIRPNFRRFAGRRRSALHFSNLRAVTTASILQREAHGVSFPGSLQSRIPNVCTKARTRTEITSVFSPRHTTCNHLQPSS